MSLKSNIGWTDATWNVLVGCTKISPGCKHCSATRDAHRLSRNPHPKVAAKYSGVVTADGKNWTGKINFSEPDLLLPLTTWKRPSRIFPNYTSDWAHHSVTDIQRDRIWAVMALADRHTYQLLTKRADLALDYLTGRSRPGPGGWYHIAFRAQGIVDELCDSFNSLHLELLSKVRALNSGKVFPLEHVWLGFSAENQEEFDRRWKYFRELAARGWFIFVSAEPLLSRVTLPPDFLRLGRRALVIAGGESGRRDLVRPTNPDWARSLRDQCESADVWFDFKQWGEWAPAMALDHLPSGWKLPRKIEHVHVNDAGVCAGVDSTWVLNLVGKRNAGRVLDGRTHDGVPRV